MSSKNHLNDAMETAFILKCPSCGQKLVLQGISLQDDEEMACPQCSSLFRLKIDGKRVDTILVRPPTGSGFGPAEGDKRY